MKRGNCRRAQLIKIWVAIFGVGISSVPALSQEQSGDQLFRFGFEQKFGATENIRLNEDSVGTTSFSDTTLSFGFTNEAGLHTLDFFASGVGRLVDDPVLGTDSGFRDPRVDLAYALEGANSRLNLDAGYFKPDLAFNDPLSQADLTDQDLSQSVGTREDFDAALQFETGLQHSIGFVLDLTARRRSFSDTDDDPLLFSNRTNRVAAGLIFRFSEVTQGRLDASDERFRADDTDGRNTDTDRFTFGLDHAFSAIDTISIDVGHSKVVESFDNLPGVETNTSGPVADLLYQREVPNGFVTAALDTFLTERGRQTTLEFGRIMQLPLGALEFSIGATRGDSFEIRPIGSIAYVTEFPRGQFNAELSRTSSISDTLAQATETTRVILGYEHNLTALSSLSLNLNYADISLIGDNTSEDGRERASLDASYSRDITKDWEFVLGYEFRYFNPEDDGSAQSNGVFFALQRDFDISR